MYFVLYIPWSPDLSRNLIEFDVVLQNAKIKMSHLMVLILDGNSEHAARAGMKIGFFRRKISNL